VTDQSMVDLANRVQRLERQNRKYRTAALGVILLFAAVFLMGQGQRTDIVEAREFVLRGADGKKMAVLGMYEGRRLEWRPGSQGIIPKVEGKDVNVPRLSFYDYKGNLATTLDDVGLTLLGEEGQEQVSVHDSFVTVSDGAGEVSLGTSGGLSWLALKGKEGTEGRANVSLYNAAFGDISPGILSISDLSGRTRVSIDASPSVQLFDESGKHRATLGSESLVTTRTGSIEKRAPSSLVLFDKEGKVMWSAP
jgi:hypothetical protein